MNPVRNFVQMLGKSGISNGVNKPAIWINIVFLILLLIALIWILVGCVPKKEHRQDGSSIIVYQEDRRGTR